MERLENTQHSIIALETEKSSQRLFFRSFFKDVATAFIQENIRDDNRNQEIEGDYLHYTQNFDNDAISMLKTATEL